jgi:hypothetical protein
MRGRPRAVPDPGGLLIALARNRGKRLRRGALAHGRALSLEIACDRGKEAASSPDATSWRRKRHAGGALGRRLVAGKAAKAPEACPVTERPGQRDIGKTIPSGKQEALNIAKGGQAFSPFDAG